MAAIRSNICATQESVNANLILLEDIHKRTARARATHHRPVLSAILTQRNVTPPRFPHRRKNIARPNVVINSIPVWCCAHTRVEQVPGCMFNDLHLHAYMCTTAHVREFTWEVHMSVDACVRARRSRHPQTSFTLPPFAGCLHTHPCICGIHARTRAPTCTHACTCVPMCTHWYRCLSVHHSKLSGQSARRRNTARVSGENK